MDKALLAWAAGVFEGEGCIYSSPNRLIPRVRAEVTSTDRDVLETFQRVVGFGLIRSHPVAANYKPAWKWVASGHERVQAFICFVWPWLHARRRAKSTEVLSTQRPSGSPKARTPHRVFEIGDNPAWQ